jgi:hypothetical protein
VASRAVDCAIVVAPLSGVALAAEEDADEPALTATVDDLSETTRQELSSETWHTGGTQPAGELLQNQLLGVEMGEGQSPVLWDLSFRRTQSKDTCDLSRSTSSGVDGYQRCGRKPNHFCRWLGILSLEAFEAVHSLSYLRYDNS